MKTKLLAISILAGMMSSTAQAEDMSTFNLGTGELLIPKIEAISSSGDSLGNYQVTMQQSEDNLEQMVLKDVLPLDTEYSNRHIARLFLDNLLTRGDLSIADEIMAEGGIIHLQDSFTPDFGTGPEALKQITSLYRGTFPDMQITIHEIIATGDKAIARFAIEGTQEGDLPNIPATGRTVSIEGMDIYRIENGKIAEFWHDADTLGLMQQLGAFE